MSIADCDLVVAYELWYGVDGRTDNVKYDYIGYCKVMCGKVYKHSNTLECVCTQKFKKNDRQTHKSVHRRKQQMNKI